MSLTEDYLKCRNTENPNQDFCECVGCRMSRMISTYPRIMPTNMLIYDMPDPNKAIPERPLFKAHDEVDMVEEELTNAGQKTQTTYRDKWKEYWRVRRQKNPKIQKILAEYREVLASEGIEYSDVQRGVDDGFCKLLQCIRTDIEYYGEGGAIYSGRREPNPVDPVYYDVARIKGKRKIFDICNSISIQLDAAINKRKLQELLSTTHEEIAINKIYV